MGLSDMTEREARFYENLILRKMERLLSHFPGHSHEILDVESGRDHLCSVCDVPLKPCAVHPGFLCCLALKGGTELFELEAALIRLQSGGYGLCVSCGQEIGKQRLKAYPTAVLCKRCFEITSGVKSKSGTAHRSRSNKKKKHGDSLSPQREKHGKE